MRTFYTFIMSLMFFAASSCAISDLENTRGTRTSGQLQPRVNQPPTPQIPTHSAAQFTSCDLAQADDVERLWYTAPSSHLNGHGQPGDFGHSSDFANGPDFNSPFNGLYARATNLAFAPTPGLLVYGGNYHYAETGNWAFNGAATGPFGVDDQWQVRVSIEEEYKIRLRWLVTDEILLEVDPSPAPDFANGQYPRINAIITPGAERLVTVTCYNGPTLITSYELPSGTQGPTIQLPEESNFSCDWGGKGVVVTPTPNAEGVLIAGTRGGILNHINLVSGDVHVVQAVGPNSELGDVGASWHNIIFDAVVHPSGEWAMVSTSEGLIRFWSLPNLEEIAPPIETATEDVNENTYMPFAVSPIGLSRDGTLMAHVTPEGDIALRDTESFELLRTLDRPEVPESDGSFGSLRSNSVLRFTFEKNSSALAVLFATGPAVYGCSGWTIEGEPHRLEAFLDGPSKAKVGEALEFVATHIGTDHVHGHQFLVNNVAMTNLSIDRSFTWIPKRAGTFEITVVLDDGFNLGETSVILTVE